MEASELVSLLLIVFFFFAAIIAPIIQQLRSTARQKKRVRAAQRKREQEAGASPAAETSAAEASAAESSDARSSGRERTKSGLRRAGAELRSLFRRDRPGDRRETEAYRDLLREDERPARFRFEEGPEAEEPQRKKPGGDLGSGLSSLDEEVQESGKRYKEFGSSWTSSSIERSAVGNAPYKRPPRGRGFERVRALPPLQRWVIMAEILGKPKALKDEPFNY